ncbi:MAG: Holliday junction resolvase RuvX [Micropepsaceae bacterium]
MSIVAVEDLPALLPPHGALIGLDLGSRVIGVAISDVMRSIASPHLGHPRAKTFTRTAQPLVDLATKERAGGWIIGLPLNMDGSEGPSAQSARAFARNLANLTPLPIVLWDERLSTAAVTRTLLDADASRRRRDEVVDKMAAAYILQGALDRLRFLERS